ncbi:bifunctional tRNA (5-methylaminomethyl-2-thiouridine)(34)-methyltransferase MnmD/FAD-dependent 5-carboxymethylaminomethyl-2-thiouridine(34) oxidoreductase MnmC [Halopseudomonas salegens]|uniref:tRNA 5-methylaminomethyl-2-thiouridine biosynthesis bifunctional protein MnmC n=1 Tax=Halopseudomonas salegens TaxID=1434072 RepID=A0A1H2EL00_9GAMM|nr:bifunctional tRNA (5-methylaminomethyl-2-thiouridine)(34)-methyltransferase MnmD/FAD-dependent 5-carboxymethylaminomethyl-2-thiouridine(34) oxidoreductase MnmC [Halopseudomonas salegens]SDT95761.1 tRNA 5-methylaminomethyl-2-thiouridine biosynthesis bifunctional protein [Halopseudomonas salegens]
MTVPANSANIDWTRDGHPFSRQFDDVYFSRESGVEETRHVFLQCNRLSERWAGLSSGAHFTIGETGFGTGLNFLCAWQLWQQTAPSNAHLHFISCEKYPLTSADLSRALQLWPELAEFSRQLLAQYQVVSPGWQHFSFSSGRVTLTLLIGDVLATLPQLDAGKGIDAWFLDGFAPARNPDMWQPALYQQLVRLASPGCTLATFTSVGDVRRGLQAAGFAMHKTRGFGHKRDMLCGELRASPTPEWQPPWYGRPTSTNGPTDKTAIVIGAGLAGCATAHALALRGWQVSLIDRHNDLAAEASGNPQGILYCKLSAHDTALSRFILSAYSYSLRLLQSRLPVGETNWQPCGVLQLPGTAKEQQRQAALAASSLPDDLLQAVNSETASQLAGIPLDRGGLWFPAAGWVNPPALCRRLVEHPNISVLLHTEALTLQSGTDGWQVLNNHDSCVASAAHVVLCTAADTRQFIQTRHLPLKAIRGQISHLPATEESQALRTVLCADGYISPARLGEHHLGASFRFDRMDTEPSAEETLSNLDLLDSLAPALSNFWPQARTHSANLKARASLRCTSPDYLPLVGPVADAGQLLYRYAELGKDASKQPTAPAPWLNGLWVNCAHGSRGLISTPLSGEIIAAYLSGEPAPLPDDLLRALHPNRFVLRNLIRGKHQPPDKPIQPS